MACRVIFKPGTESVDQVFATNGRPSILFKSLTDASQGDKNSAYNAYIKTQTQSFKNWFGASKVVDENGEPLVVYHGTRALNITEFDREDSTDEGDFGKGFYFTDSLKTAENYAPYGGTVMSVFLNIQNPEIIKDQGFRADLEKEQLEDLKNILLIEALMEYL